MPPIDEETKRRIDQRIRERGLNDYGDPQGTVYAGGTPLFNEMTGQRLDRYAYIMKKHPELGK
jgi:hypothetical protein